MPPARCSMKNMYQIVSKEIIISLWSPMKKLNNQMYMYGNKKQTVKVRDKNTDLKETKDLYGRLDGPGPLPTGIPVR